jgi:hypothetical protein
MGFRELFLKRLADKHPAPKEINPLKFQAFSRKDIEMSIQLYQHLKNLGNTFEDLINWVDSQRETERRSRARDAIKETIHLTRADRKRLAGGSTKSRQRSERHGNT